MNKLVSLEYPSFYLDTTYTKFLSGYNLQFRSIEFNSPSFIIMNGNRAWTMHNEWKQRLNEA